MARRRGSAGWRVTAAAAVVLFWWPSAEGSQRIAGEGGTGEGPSKDALREHQGEAPDDELCAAAVDCWRVSAQSASDPHPGGTDASRVSQAPLPSVRRPAAPRASTGGTPPVASPDEWADQFTRITGDPAVADADRSWGVAWIDFDGDGWLDLSVANLEGLRLYRNQSGAGFAPVSGSSFVTGSDAWGGGCTWGDYNNDGDPDLFVANWDGQHNLLYENNGDGSLTRVLTGAPVDVPSWSISPSWADFDNDGDLDLYVANHDTDPPSEAGRNFLYRNDGSGFTRVLDSPTVSESSHSNHASWADFDNDGDVDLLVLNAWGAHRSNRLYRNEGGGMFTVVAAGDVTADDSDSWSASWGDIDNDGDLDLFVASEPENLLYENDGRGSLVRVAGQDLSPPRGTSFGSGWADVDNDGDLDLFVAVAGISGPEPDLLFENDGGGRFTRVTAGAVVSDLNASLGAAWGDYDRDGDLDLYVADESSADRNNALYRNDGCEGSWVTITLVGVQSNRSAIGARVTATAIIRGQRITQLREVSAQTGKNGQSSLEVHFGFGDASRIETLVVRWPSGLAETYGGLGVNRRLILREGDGAPAQPKPRRPSGRVAGR